MVTGRQVKHFAWDEVKNERLKRDRGVGFEEIVFHIAHGDLLDVLEHPNQERYRIPSRKATRSKNEARYR